MTFWFWKQTRKAIIFRYFTSVTFHWFIERSRGRISQPKRNFRCLDAAKVFSGENWSWILFWGLKYQYLNSKKSLQNDPKYYICITEQCWARAKAAVHEVGCPDLNISSNFFRAKCWWDLCFMARKQNRDSLKMLAGSSLTLTAGSKGSFRLSRPTKKVHLWTKRLGTKVSFSDSVPQQTICNTDELGHSNLSLSLSLIFFVLISIWSPWILISKFPEKYCLKSDTFISFRTKKRVISWH